MLQSVVRYRGLIRAIVTKELAGRYSGSLLGPLWLLIPPVFMIFIYTVVFSRVMHARLAGSDDAFGYSIYLCAGMLVWTPFLEAMQRAKGVFIEHSNLIKKSAFPRLILFVPVATVALVNFFLLGAAFSVFLAIVRHSLAPALLWIPVCAAIATLLGLAVGAVLAVLNVFFRDVGQTAELAAQLLFWATPIVYPLAILPERAHDVIRFNPLLALVQGAQDAALGSGTIEGSALVYPLAATILATATALFLYRRARSDLMDQL